MKKVSLNYLKQMEPYELRIRDIIKTRIRKFYKVSLKGLRISKEKFEEIRLDS